jgi:deoxyadenosine/deoxycytidine kinase
MDKLEEQYRDCDEVVVLREPVHLWTHVVCGKGVAENMLQLFYTDPTKYALMFQLYIFRTSLNELQRALDDPNVQIVLCERSLESSRAVFAQMLHDAGNMTALEFAVYESMFTDEIVSKYYPTEIVYLDASAEVCHARVQQRCRTGEETIPLDYLKKCAAYYTTWLQYVLVSDQDKNRAMHILRTDALSTDQVFEQFMKCM